MENHKNIKYKKKYNKYKNKYYKLTKNKIYGGAEYTTIATVISIIALLVALGYYVYDKNDSISQKIKDFFNLSDNRVKNKIERLQNEQKQEALKKEIAQKKREKVESNAQKIKNDRYIDDIDDPNYADTVLVNHDYVKNRRIETVKKNLYKNTLILWGEKKNRVLEKYLQSNKNIWYEELSTVLEMFNEDPEFKGKKVCGKGDQWFYQINLCKERE